MKYSILTFIFGNYECLREPLELSENCEYVVVTDNKNLKSNNWTIKYLPDEYNMADGFTKSFYVRYHPFEFVNNDICIVLDGSILIKKSLDKLVNDFSNSGADACFSIHYIQWNARNEYSYWTKYRGYSELQAKKGIAFMNAIGYKPDYKGCFETTFKICKNNDINNDLNNFVYKCLEKVTNDKMHVDRVDQSIFSAVINTNFNTMNILPVCRQAYQSDYLMCCHHNTNTPNIASMSNIDNLYLFNKPIKIYKL